MPAKAATHNHCLWNKFGGLGVFLPQSPASPSKHDQMNPYPATHVVSGHHRSKTCRPSGGRLCGADAAPDVFHRAAGTQVRAMVRLFRLATCVAAAVAMAALTLPGRAADAAAHEQWAAGTASLEFNEQDGSLTISRRVVLFLDSA